MNNVQDALNKLYSQLYGSIVIPNNIVEQWERIRMQSGRRFEETNAETSSTGTRTVSFWLGFTLDWIEHR